ncbi:Uncharacterized protein BM_BM1581 [Brugia malayi]|uniref:Uncharacterized protein n=2 Tax=Brugia malayi TaxID=6279 RepID=A0A0K0J264_BRUMA|nr:Uncharacterized protein BM_BM1581 [Brugia malayi]VIO97599.1 Uncharacterized protein BM_BM1581 [Brugia malayi]
MNELSVPKYSPNIYQYISGIIENALKQTEQILLNLKTQRNDTVINVKNATVKLNNEEKKKSSTMHMQNVKQTSNDNDKTLLSVTMQCPQKVTNSSWQIMDLLCFPIENEERNLKFTDRIFVSIDQKSIMLMREYDNLTNCIHQKVQTKCNQCYQKQIKMIKLQQQQTKLDQQKGISEQFPQRQQRIQQIQKPKANENGS